MSSACDYKLKLDNTTLKAFQKIEHKIYRTGGQSISRGRGYDYVEAYPLELPPGKACHFTLAFKTDAKV